MSMTEIEIGMIIVCIGGLGVILLVVGALFYTDIARIKRSERAKGNGQEGEK